MTFYIYIANANETIPTAAVGAPVVVCRKEIKLNAATVTVFVVLLLVVAVPVILVANVVLAPLKTNSESSCCRPCGISGYKSKEI